MTVPGEMVGSRPLVAEPPVGPDALCMSPNCRCLSAGVAALCTSLNARRSTRIRWASNSVRSMNTISKWRRHLPLLALAASAILLPLLSAGAEGLKTELVGRITKEQVAALFPRTAKANVHANWPLVQTELQRFGLGDSKEVVVYALATIRVETSNFSSDPEQPSTHSTTIDRPGYGGIQASGTERPFGAYDSTMRLRKDGTPIINKQLGNCYYTGVDEKLMRSRQGMPPRPECEDGILFRGRGFVQLTGRYNYE
jgi:hypothetical protein